MNSRLPKSPSSSVDLDSALEHLYRRNLHLVRLGLEPERALLQRLENPQDSFLAIHVAGTNGKGSVCAMIASVLQAAGFRTGLYTSPHLVRFNERVRVNGEALPDADLQRLVTILETAVQANIAAGERDVTFFEFTTALAFQHFRERGVQIGVLETGMGGRLDATNVVTPVVSVITSIGLDHQQYLGDTLEKIAGEKAGIIKEGRPVVCGALPEEALGVIRQVARERHAPWLPASQVCTVRRTAQSLKGQRVVIETQEVPVGRVTLPLLGEHQLANCAMAVAALGIFTEQTGLIVAPEAIRAGLGSVRWPARCQVVEQEPPVLVDGGHNPEAATALARTLEDLREQRPLGLVVSFLADKDAASFLREVGGRVRRCWAVPIHNERAMPMDQILAAARGAGLEPVACADLASAVQEARAWAREHDGLLCIAGSLYLAGEALQLLGAEF